MKSFLFLLTCSLCAACGVFAADITEAQPTQFIEETQSLSCSKCHKSRCGGCNVACSGCKSIIFGCKDGKKPGCTCPKEFTEATEVADELACKDGKKPGCTCPKEFTEATDEEIACKCRDNGGMVACKCKGKIKRTVIAGCPCTKKKVPAPVVPGNVVA